MTNTNVIDKIVNISDRRVTTGVTGLDDILHGGLVPGRSYLVRGEPGAGKTILGFHYLTAGVDAGEQVLFINLEEPTADIEANAASLGFDLSDVHFLDLSPSSDFFTEDQSYSVFAAEDVEQAPITDRIAEEIRAVEPDRVFLDPVTQFRYLTSDDYQFRKQILSFMQFLEEGDATVLFTSQRSETTDDDDLQFMSDGIVELRYEGDVRRIRVPKFRGSAKESGSHGLAIRDDGLHVYPVLTPGDHRAEFTTEAMSSGVPELDALLDGGIERGTVTVLSGPTGAGKTTTGTQFMTQAATRGERSVAYLFEESESTFRHRSEAVGMPVSEMVEEGTLEIEEVEPLEKSPEEFASDVREAVEDRDASVVMIDGIKGYRLSIEGDEDALVRKLHALGRYLKNVGVTVILVDEISEVTGDFRATNAGVSYLADTILFLRHVEMHGQLHKVVGVLKKRVGTFERTLREFEITADGIELGEPLTGLRGVLHGTPEFVERSAEE
ncbi:MAG: ATPase domain-containing protein [Haloarculaceae archaeon]